MTSHAAGHAAAVLSSSNQPYGGAPPDASRFWSAVVLAISAPLLFALFAIIWRTPIPLSEAVALLEDVARRPALSFLSFDTSYYRPLYHMSLSLLWSRAGSIAATLNGVRLLQLVPVGVLIVLLVRGMRIQSGRDAAAGLFAVAVLIGMPAFRNNLELPLSYTTVGMPIVLGVWLLLNRPATRLHTPLILLLTIVAVGFKEQGLTLVPLVVAMWWMGAPGSSRQSAIAVTLLAAAYVALRLTQSGSWPLFQQDVGYGFTRLSIGEAEARFGAFPLWIFLYSSVSTAANVLFSEPTDGVFRIVSDMSRGRPEPWELNHLVSSCALTGLILWYAVHLWRGRRTARTEDCRLLVALAVVLAACAALSFNYSRDRLGGMAAPLYALTAYHAMRHAMDRAAADGGRMLMPGFLLLALAGAWELRAVATLETARVTSYRNWLEWVIRLPERRAEFAERPVYLGIMEAMVNQGIAVDTPRPTRLPRPVEMLLREP